MLKIRPVWPALALSYALPILSTNAQVVLFAPDWVFSPSFAVEGHFSASACVGITDSNQMEARARAMGLAREEIALYLKGFDPASDVSSEVMPKVYLSDSVEWQRDDESHQFCVLASMNYRDLQVAENKLGRSLNAAEIEQRFNTLSLLSEKGQEREMLADMQEIKGLEERLQGWIDANNTLNKIEVRDIALRKVGHITYVITATLINHSSVSFATAWATLSILTDSRPYPIASDQVDLLPLGGVMPGEEVTFSNEIMSSMLDEAVYRLGSQDYRFEVILDRISGPGDKTIAHRRNLDDPRFADGKTMTRLQSLKAKWSLPN